MGDRVAAQGALQSKMAEVMAYNSWLEAALVAVLRKHPEELTRYGAAPPGSRVAAMQEGLGLTAEAAKPDNTPRALHGGGEPAGALPNFALCSDVQVGLPTAVQGAMVRTPSWLCIVHIVAEGST